MTEAVEKPLWTNQFLKKAIAYAGKEEIRRQIQDTLIDPLIRHIMDRIFPYIILTCVLFVLLLIVILVTLGIIIFQIRKGGAVNMVAAGG
jgi:hypothetical protein